MWPTSYPECSPAQADGTVYDYTIVGRGTAGCVLASRLSEDPNVTVLVLEKGGVKDDMVSRMPLLSQNMFLGDTLQVQSTRWPEPIPEANGRRTGLWTVGIGGASRMNAMLLTRGCPVDHAAWSSELGLHDWGWESVEPYFGKFENAVAHPESKAKTWRNVTDDEIDDYFRRSSHTSLHFSCTYPMSNDDEMLGVVDQKLGVYGFKDLRIADASVFPRVPSGHTMAPVMMAAMVAERCASVWRRSGKGEVAAQHKGVYGATITTGKDALYMIQQCPL